MTTRLQRFDFGGLRDFRGPLVAAAVQEEVMEEVFVPPPPPVFSEEDLEAARATAKQTGYAEGYDAGLKHAAEQADAKRVTAEKTITHLATSIDGLQRRYQELLNQEAKELAHLVLMITRKVTGVVLDTRGAEAVAGLVTRCLPVVLSKPQLIIELNPAAFEQTMDHIENLLKTNGFEGEVQFRSNTTIGEHDAILDWGSGQATRDTEALWEGIETLLATTPITLTPLAQGAEQPIVTAGQHGSEPAGSTTPPILL